MRRTKKVLKNRIKKMERVGDTCYICGIKLQPHNPAKANGFTLDHVTAKSKEGTVRKPCCKSCNERKAAMDIIVLEKGTTVKVDGIPFELVFDTKVFGEKENQLLLPQTKDVNRESKPK